jgi:hypothetical protein
MQATAKQTLGAATRVRSTSGEPGRPTLDAESFLISETVVPCYRGQRLLDNRILSSCCESL